MGLRATPGRIKLRRLSKLGLAGLVALVLAGVSAHAALRALVDRQSQAARAALPPHGLTTGTIALPHLPLPPEAAALIPDTSVRPAAPFAMTHASATDRGRALQCLTSAIYHEAASEPDAGQRAVAQVILNRVRHPVFPATVCGVVFQGSERTGCQFSFACDGSLERGMPAGAVWTRALRVAAAALNGRVEPAVGLATHYHTYAVTPSWNRQLVMTAAIGAHFFHRWQGWWGTPAAFRQSYAGGEPLPEPHARVAPAPLPLAALVPPPAPAAIRPAYAASVTPVAATPLTDPSPGESQVLDRWKDSGKPLR